MNARSEIYIFLMKIFYFWIYNHAYLLSHSFKKRFPIIILALINFYDKYNFLQKINSNNVNIITNGCSMIFSLLLFWKWCFVDTIQVIVMIQVRYFRVKLVPCRGHQFRLLPVFNDVFVSLLLNIVLLVTRLKIIHLCRYVLVCYAEKLLKENSAWPVELCI